MGKAQDRRSAFKERARRMRETSGNARSLDYYTARAAKRAIWGERASFFINLVRFVVQVAKYNGRFDYQMRAPVSRTSAGKMKDEAADHVLAGVVEV